MMYMICLNVSCCSYYVFIDLFCYLRKDYMNGAVGEVKNMYIYMSFVMQLVNLICDLWYFFIRFLMLFVSVLEWCSRGC